MKAIRKVLASIRRADEQFHLFDPGDRIAVGVSGGKDSLVLFYALTLYQRFQKKDFVLVPIHLDLGFSSSDHQPLKEWFSTLGYELVIADAHEVALILEKQKGAKAKLSCSICSRMKKAAINEAAHQHNCQKVAFAHHGDDAIETLMMNEIFGARVTTFAPKMYLERTQLTFIRPLILTREATIKSCAKELQLPIEKSGCPNDHQTMREAMKTLLNDIYRQFPEAKDNFLTMLTNYPQNGLWEDALSYPIGDNFWIRPVITAKDMYHHLELRSRVFVEEQGFAYSCEFDETLLSADAFLLYHQKTPIGTVIIRDLGDRCFQISRLALLSEYRGQGNGQRLLTWVEKRLFDQANPCRVYLNAQLPLVDYYLHLGYQIEGEPFQEGHLWHQKMFKNLG